jgi:hypothetical protein
MKKYLTLALLILASCATKPQLSPQQRRALQVRTFENTTYDNVFRAFKTIMQDDGYVVKNQDLEGGLIVAQIQKTDRGGAFFAALGGNKNYRTGESFEISANLEKINKSTVESRIIIQKVESFSMGGQQGDEILDPEMYKSFYNKVKVEVERRKAQGR